MSERIPPVACPVHSDLLAKVGESWRRAAPLALDNPLRYYYLSIWFDLIEMALDKWELEEGEYRKP